ncbi:50S ribosomal protein L25/general stress protein Ctc [Tessaracoccus sp.]
MAEFKLHATTRTEFGKGPSRRLRRDGGIPAVVYGHGTEPQHIALPAQETFLMLRQSNVLMEISIEGQKTPFMALPKQVHRDPITSLIEHIDLVIVRAGEKVSVEVPLTVVGEAERGALVNIDLTSLLVLAPATSIPNEIEVSVEGLVVGDQILAGDVKLPDGVVYEHDPEAMVLIVAPMPVAEPVAEVAEVADATEGDDAGE